MAEDAEKKAFDVVLLHGRTDDGDGMKVLRVSGTAEAGDSPAKGNVQAGEVRPLREGKPITGEVVTLKPRDASPWVCDVDVAMPAPPRAPTPGPAQVSSPAYRASWERIFGDGDDLN